MTYFAKVNRWRTPLPGKTAQWLLILWLVCLPLVWLCLLLLGTALILMLTLSKHWPAVLLLLAICFLPACTSQPPTKLDCHPVASLSLESLRAVINGADLSLTTLQQVEPRVGVSCAY